MSLVDLLLTAVGRKASDLHVSVGSVPMIRLNGDLCPLDQEEISSSSIQEILDGLLSTPQKEIFRRDRSIDFGYSIDSGERFRINAYYERGFPALAIRWLDNRFRSLTELGLPQQLDSLAKLQHGLVLVTGPTGSGKTTTLSALLHQINANRRCHILTIEDPIEYIHPNQSSLIHQRELHSDVPDFANAVRSAMREDPDVILVGEMRDLETMRASLMAAETGHLVFSTLHTGDAVGALDRMVGAFPGGEQESIRQQLSMVLRSIVAQHLLPIKDGSGRVPIVEILNVNSAVSHLIRTGKSQQLVSAMESGRSIGMQTIDFALADAVSAELVGFETAKRYTRDLKLFEDLIQRALKIGDKDNIEALKDGR
ncbi:PilT/PilU family type 4a pilus ATPase [Myxococcota bacterium]|nr:PilT/PilU family type 4a pilus ATPase [Myxococcota bacterium]